LSRPLVIVRTVDNDLVTILQGGRLINIELARLRKGDVVVFQAGEVLPADLKLVEANELEVDEFDVTGEVMPVARTMGELDVLLYMGSRVTRGTGKGLVLAVGEDTEYGRVLQQSRERRAPGKTPFFRREYVLVTLLMAPAFAIAFLRPGDHLLMIPVFLFLAALVLVLQDHELVEHWLTTREIEHLKGLGIAIREPDALRRMQEVDIICFDKTGVLTTRRMDIQKIYYAGEGVVRADSPADGKAALLTRLACALCHDVAFYEKVDLASPVDKALIAFAVSNGINVQEELSKRRRVHGTVFQSENRYMQSGFEWNGEALYLAKGDPAVILKMCGRYLAASGEERAADLGFWISMQDHTKDITGQGGTAIALAYAACDAGHVPDTYTFLCLLHLDNSLQSGAAQLVRSIRREAKRSILLTGDRADTAARVGDACEISAGSRICMTGELIGRMPLDEVSRQLAYCSMLAKLLPSQKALIIRLLQRRQHKVAMVGDGPNDGIALKVADVGISFVEDSSPIARKLAGIWLHDLPDLLELIQCSKRLAEQAEELHSLRAVALVLILLGMYLWALALANIRV